MQNTNIIDYVMLKFFFTNLLLYDTLVSPYFIKYIEFLKQYDSKICDCYKRS